MSFTLGSGPKRNSSFHLKCIIIHVYVLGNIRKKILWLHFILLMLLLIKVTADFPELS